MSTLLELDRQECLALLRTVRLGRVVYSDRALPAVGPATFALVGTQLLLRPIEDGLAVRLDGQVVAFEVGDLGRRADAGWSVVVTGSARLLGPTTDLARREPAGLAAEHSRPLSLTPGAITGRRVLPADRAPVLFGPRPRTSDPGGHGLRRATVSTRRIRRLEEDDMTRQPAPTEHHSSLTHPGRLAAELLTAAAMQFGLSRALSTATADAERREVDEVDRRRGSRRW